MTRAAQPQNYPDATLLELGRLLLKVAGNPETRRPLLNAVRKVEPDRIFPDQQVEDLREEFTAKLEADKLEAARKATENRLATQRQGLISSGRYTEDQVKVIESEVMPRYGVADYEAGATLYGATMAPAKPRNAPPKGGGSFELPTFEGLLENPIKASRDMAYSVIDEINAAKQR